MTSHASARAGWFGVSLLAATLVLAPSAVLPQPFAFAAVVIVLAIAPGAWLARRVLPEAPHDARVALALLLSPFACALVVSLLRQWAPDARAAARVFATLVALLASAEALRPRARATTALGARSGWALALAVGALILLSHALVPMLALRSDGAFHAGATHAALRALPPGDPWFAGLPLRYFWGLHVWAACGVALVPALSPAQLLPVSGAFAAVAAVLAASTLTRWQVVAPRSSALAGVLVLVGTTPFAWLLLAARGLTGETTGFAPLLERGADTALRALDPGLLHPSLVLPLDKFVVVTPFAWGLAGAIVVPSLLLRWCMGPTARHAAAVSLALAAVCALHPVAGVALVAAAGVGVLTSALTRALAWREVLRLLAFCAVALVVLLPPLRMFAPAAEGGASVFTLRFSWHGLFSALVGGLVLGPGALLALHRTRDEAPVTPWGGLRRALFGGMLAALVGAACVLQLGGDNQSKFLNLAFALAAPLAAVGLARWASTPARRNVLVAGLTAAWLPTLAALGWSYAHETRQSDDAPSSPPGLLLAMLAQEAAPDAWVVDATLDPSRGAAAAVPAVTGRALVWSGAFMARKWGHPADALAQRERVAAALAQGHWPDGPEGEWLASGGHEVWLFAPATLAADAANATVVARAGGAQLVRFTPPR